MLNGLILLLPLLIPKNKNNQKQLIDAIHKKDTGLTKVQVGQVVDAMIEAITGGCSSSYHKIVF